LEVKELEKNYRGDGNQRQLRPTRGGEESFKWTEEKRRFSLKQENNVSKVRAEFTRGKPQKGAAGTSGEEWCAIGGEKCTSLQKKEGGPTGLTI